MAPWAAHSARRDQINAICRRVARSCGASMERASSRHCAEKWRYASQRSMTGFPFQAGNAANSARFLKPLKWNSFRCRSWGMTGAMNDDRALKSKVKSGCATANPAAGRGPERARQSCGVMPATAPKRAQPPARETGTWVPLGLHSKKGCGRIRRQFTRGRGGRRWRPASIGRGRVVQAAAVCSRAPGPTCNSPGGLE
jgi:hypothetical protein